MLDDGPDFPARMPPLRQPGGLPDSSRGSGASDTPGSGLETEGPPKGCQIPTRAGIFREPGQRPPETIPAVPPQSPHGCHVCSNPAQKESKAPSGATSPENCGHSATGTGPGLQVAPRPRHRRRTTPITNVGEPLAGFHNLTRRVPNSASRSD